MGDSSDTFTLARSTSHLLHRAHQVAAERFAKRTDKLSLRQYAVLAAIADKPGASQMALVRLTSVDRSTLADMLKRLVELGLVQKSRSPDDARAQSVALTAQGKRMLQEAAEHARKADQAVLEALPKSKRIAFQEALQRLARNIDKAAEEEAKRARKERKRLKAEARKAEARKAEKSSRGARGG